MDTVGDIGFMVLFIAVMLAGFGRFNSDHKHTRAHSEILPRRKPRG